MPDLMHTKPSFQAGSATNRDRDHASGKGLSAKLLRTLFWSVVLLSWAVPGSWAQFSFPVQPLGRIVCIYSAVPNQVRSEALSSRVGDARLDCTNDGIYNPQLGNENNMVQYVTSNFTLSLNTVVSGIDDGTTTSSILAINQNDSYFPTANSVLPAEDTCGIVGGPPRATPDPRYPCPQKAIKSGPNSITWNSVQFPVPGAPNSLETLPNDIDADGTPECIDIFDQASTDSCFNVVTTVRLTNIFANSAAIGAGGAIFGNLTIFSSVGISVAPSNQQTLANVFQGLIVDFGAVGHFQCVEGIRTFNIILEEGFAGSFKTGGAPTFIQGDFAGESGYPVLELSDGFPPQQVGGMGGGATQATRFKIRLFDVPEGVVPKFPNTIDEDGSGVEGCPVEPGFRPQDLCLQVVEGADEDGAGGATGDGVGDYEVPLVDGDGQVIYEVMNGDPFRPQEIAVPANFTCMAGSPTTQLQLLATYAPLSEEGGTTPAGPVPRFVDTGGDPVSTGPTDLQLVKTTDSTVVVPGVDQVDFILTVTNFGPRSARGVDLVDVLPAGLSLVSADGCGTSNNILTCALGNIGVNQSRVIQIVTSVDANAAGVLVNNASVLGGWSEPTPDPHPNMDTAAVAVLTDLTIAALTGPTVAQAAGVIDVSVDVANMGGVAAGAFQLGFYFSPDSLVTTGDAASATTCTFPVGLAGGAAANCAGPIGVPAGLAPDTYYLGAIVDIAGTVVEHTETNNTRVADTGTISIEEPAGPAMIGLFRNGLWLLDRNGNGGWDPGVDGIHSLGQAGDIPVVGDWNDDGRDEIGFFRNGLWLLDYNGNGVWNGPGVDRSYLLGQAGDIPVVGDWNGDGADQVGIFRNGQWVLDLNGNGQWDGVGTDLLSFLGQAGDKPVIGDWNADGADEVGLFRNGLWLLDMNNNGTWNAGIDRIHTLGQAGDMPLVGNFMSGVGDEIGFFRDSTGMWLLDLNGNGQWNGKPTDHLSFLGQVGDNPVIGDWNEDGLDEIGFFRNGMWLLDLDRNGQWDGPGTDHLFFFGQAGDTPVTGRW